MGQIRGGRASEAVKAARVAAPSRGMTSKDTTPPNPGRLARLKTPAVGNFAQTRKLGRSASQPSRSVQPGGPVRPSAARPGSSAQPGAVQPG
ncbi:hypothetical protein, partial [Paenarthrobacter nitroguajacolicus]|uniref:hypothetical protein n=1 Tax=Paenarthrobacter nitroguajacolicus TaxID=211146 RepID=UPI00286B5A18